MALPAEKAAKYSLTPWRIGSSASKPRRSLDHVDAHAFRRTVIDGGEHRHRTLCLGKRGQWHPCPTSDWAPPSASREMTLLCSPKVAQHHQGAGAAFPARQDGDSCRVQTSVRARCGESGRSHISPFSDVCDRLTCARRRLRRALRPDDGNLKPHAAAWMISLASSQPTGNPVLRVGTLKRAEMDHFC
jgi:hypothetical protein